MSARIVASEGLPVTQARDVHDSKLSLSADVVVVGSGAGGAIAAYELARAGRSVIVLESGPYVASADMKESLLDAWERLYVEQGWQTNHNNDVKILQGSCVGGSSVVSAGIMQRTPDHVLKLWQSQYGLTNLTRYALEPYFQSLEENLSIHKNTDAEINANSRKLVDGAKAQGMNWNPLARAVKDCALTGMCLSGCQSGRKQSMLVTYLPWAQAFGAQIFADTTVTKILSKKGKVTGLQAEMRNPATGAKVADVEVSAKVVVLAAGAVGTPRLLKASRLAKGSGQLGRNFSLNPAVAVLGKFAEPVYGWRGAFAGVGVDEFSRSEKGGFYMQASMAGPEMLLWAAESGTGEAHMNFMQDYKNMACVNVHIQDGADGDVGILTDASAITWGMSHDRFTLVKKAVTVAAKTLFAAGATEVFLPTFPSMAVTNEAHVEPLLERLLYGTNGETTFRYFSYHPQGTCRMGFDPDHAVVNPYGECHDVKNLFVADASILPPGLNGNPELTVGVLSSYIADHIRMGGARYFG